MVCKAGAKGEQQEGKSQQQQREGDTTAQEEQPLRTEYLVKWRERSYRQAQWVPEDVLQVRLCEHVCMCIVCV